MKIRLAYGKDGLEFELPDGVGADVVNPRYVEACADEAGAIRAALRRPIRSAGLVDLAGAETKVGIVFNDITRATPYDVIMPVLLDELRDVGRENITLFNATGTHRLNTEAELRGMLGDDCVDNYRIVQNDAEDTDSHVTVGTTRRGNEIRVLREYVECDLRILTGFIEPHFFAGFSGGPKACVPGLAELGTVMRNHCSVNLDSAEATWGVTYGNPLWEELLEGAKLAGEVFLLNVALNRDKQVTDVFAGEMEAAHRAGCDYVKDTAMAAVGGAYDIVVTSNSGYPLDLNMYQSVKGMSAAARIVKPGGTIIIAADCWDGFPEHGLYKQLLCESGSAAELLERVRRPGFAAQDAWQGHIHAMICEKAEVYFYSDNLSDEQIRSGFMRSCRDIGETIGAIIKREGREMKVCVLPEGPVTMPYLAQ